MSDQRDTLEEMQDRLTKMMAQGFTFGTQAALWSVNRALDAAEAVVDLAASEQPQTSETAAGREWPDARLDRLRLPPQLFKIDLGQNPKLVEWLDKTVLYSGSPVPPVLRKLFSASKHPLPKKAAFVTQPAGTRGSRWFVMDFLSERGMYHVLDRSADRLRITPVIVIQFVVEKPGRPQYKTGRRRNLFKVAPRAFDAMKKALAELPVAMELAKSAEFEFMGKGEFGDSELPSAAWRILQDGKQLAALFENLGANTNELWGLVFVEPFEVEASTDDFDGLDLGIVSRALRSAAFSDDELLGPMVLPRESTSIRWQIATADRETTYTLIRGGDCITVFEALEEEDQYVDPVGDGVAERYLQLANPEQSSDARQQLLLQLLLVGDLDCYIADSGILRRGRPYEVLSWLTGQRARLQPVESGFGGSLEMVRDYYQRAANPPRWLDSELMAESEEAFDLYKIPLMTALLLGALPQTYACWKGAQVLTVTGRLAIDPRMPRKEQVKRLQHRVAATAQFVLNVMEPGAFDAPDGTGLLTTLTVRMLHAGVRVVIGNAGRVGGGQRDASGQVVSGASNVHQPWDYDRLGRPINQEDLLGTMLAFSTVTFDKLRMLNVELSDRQEAAIFHRWKVMGFYLGIREDLLEELKTPDDGRALWSRIAERQQKYEPDNPTLAEARNCTDLNGALIDYARTVTTVGLPAEMAEYLVRYLSGHQIADRLGVPEGDEHVWPRAATLFGRANMGVMDWMTDNSKLAQRVFRRANELLYQTAFETWVSKEPVVYYRRGRGEDSAGEGGEER